MVNELYQYVGSSIVFEGMRCQLIEIIENGPALVFTCPEQTKPIQANQYGDAGRRAPNNYTVPLLSECHPGLHPAAEAVIPQHRHQAFVDYFRKARAQS
jgi:hypothetical protein